MSPSNFINTTTEEIHAWSDMVGNERAVEVGLRLASDAHIIERMFLAGPSGSGKSSLLNHICRIAACDANAKAPCRSCKGCEKFQAKERNEGLFSYLGCDTTQTPFHYLPINCRNTTPARLHEELESIRFVQGRRIVHLEEASGLKRQSCDESITDIMDSPGFESCQWFATAVTDSGLDVQFRRRWAVKIVTERPQKQDAAKLLARMCRDRGIDVDRPKTLLRLVDRSWGVIGLAKAVIANAALASPPVLSRRIVESYALPKANPWRQEFFSSEQ